MSVWAFFVWYSVVRPSELSLLFTPYLFFRLLQIDWMQSKRSISFHLSPFSPSVKGRGKKLANAYCMRALHVQIITHPLDRKRERGAMSILSPSAQPYLWFWKSSIHKIPGNVIHERTADRFGDESCFSNRPPGMGMKWTPIKILQFS